MFDSRKCPLSTIRQLWILTFFLCSLIACSPGSKSNEPINTADRWLIEGVTVLSAERSEPLVDAWVGIEGERIAEVGVGQPGSAWQGVETIQGEGRFLTPGLIDSHVHLLSVPGLPLPVPRSLKGAARAYRQQLPSSYLYFGFTTLVDLNAVDPGVIEDFQQAWPAPDVHHCGGALALANGYPMAFLPEKLRFKLYENFLYDPDQAETIPSRYSPEDHSPAAAVGRVEAEGGICVKAFHEDGFGDAKIWPAPSQDMLSQVLAESRDRGLTMALHANSFQSHASAAELGVDVVVHGMWNWDELDGEEGVPEDIDAVLEAYVQKEVGVMPTLQVLAGLRDLYDPDFLTAPLLAKALPAKMIDYYKTPEGQWFAEDMRENDFAGLSDEAIRERFGSVQDQGVRVARELASRDAKLLFGSDTPSGPTYANPPGLNGFLELRQWAEVGISLEKIFRAATLDNAEAFHLGDRYGTVEKGKVANLLLLDENPLATVEAWGSIHQVVVRGKALNRESLAADFDL